MKTIVSASHRRAQGTSIVEILISLVLLSSAITGTLHIHALAAGSIKHSYHVTTEAFESGSRNERQLRESGLSSRGNSAHRDKRL